MLSGFYVGHPGVSRIQVLAWGVVWWPGLEGMVEDVVEEFFGMSANTTITNISTNATVELANQTMVSAPC